MKIKTTIESDKVRGLCIRMRYCTKATNEQYEALLRTAPCEFNEYNVTWFTAEIATLSDSDKFMKSYGCNYKEFMESIAWGIANECTTTSIEL